MKIWLPLFGFFTFAILPLSAQDQEPATPTPSPQSSSVTENPSPTPSPEANPSPGATPGSGVNPFPSPSAPSAPDLLPESNALPQPTAPPPVPQIPHDLIPGVRTPKPPITEALRPPIEQQAKERVRFRQLRTTMYRDAYSLYLWERSKRAATFEVHREYVRAYYHYVTSGMRRLGKVEGKLDPFLDALITGFENENVALATQGGLRSTIPLRDYAKPETQESLRREAGLGD